MTLKIPTGTPLWIRDLDVEGCPRYLVNGYGFIIAIQEPDCDFWHQRELSDVSDVKDGCLPDKGEFDEKLADVGDTILYDTQPDFLAGFRKKH